MILRTLLFFALLLPLALCAGNPITRGKLVLKEHPQAVQDLVENGLIQLDKTRKISDFLTNRDLLEFEGCKIPKRKKAFLRHIKHLNEQLEWAILTKEPISDSLYEVLYELVLFQQSLKRAVVLDANVDKSFREQIQIYRTTRRSLRAFHYSIPTKKMPIDLAETDSPYWHSVPDSMLFDQFDALAKKKKIKSKKRMVILFDGLSYSGSAPKIKGLDLDFDNEWSLKWGDEVHTDVLGSRIFAALGYDVDHPYYYGKDQLTLVFPPDQTVKNAAQLIDSIQFIYGVDLKQFITEAGKIDSVMISAQKKLEPFNGFAYVRFIKCAVEGRPDRVKRIGSILPNELSNEKRRPLRAALLAHAFIGNWDTREENTCLTQVHDGDYHYRVSATFSDLGTSFGVKVNSLPPDFKVGLVNEFSWDVFKIKRNKIILKNPINAIQLPYQEATYSDLKWMAYKISRLTGEILQKMIDETGWPTPIATLYFHKLAARRASILTAFEIEDPHPIPFDRSLTLVENGITLIKNGKLVVDYDREANPESFMDTKGRIRNYGN